MRDARDYKLDIASVPTSDAKSSPAPAPRPAASRDYLRIFFECCKTYGRVYRSASTGTFDARCPKCGRVTAIR